MKVIQVFILVIKLASIFVVCKLAQYTPQFTPHSHLQESASTNLRELLEK